MMAHWAQGWAGSDDEGGGLQLVHLVGDDDHMGGRGTGFGESKLWWPGKSIRH